MTTIPARDFRCGTESYRAPSSRPSRADLQRPDYALLAAYTAGVVLARNTYFREHPVSAPRTIPCVCGGWFATDKGLEVHQAQHCTRRAS